MQSDYLWLLSGFRVKTQVLQKLTKKTFSSIWHILVFLISGSQKFVTDFNLLKKLVLKVEYNTIYWITPLT